MSKHTFIHDMSRTISSANQYLMMQVEQGGLKGIAPSHGDILSELFTTDGISMSELSQRILRDPSTVTALVRKLVDMGLARTEKCPTDKRSVMVYITPRGLEFKGEFERISQRLIDAWSEGISEQDLQAAARVLQVANANLCAALEIESEQGQDRGVDSIA